jgi:hypothetical protein
MSSRPCSTADCTHRVTKFDSDMCTFCKKVYFNLCTFKGCANTTKTKFCKHHCHKTIQCTYIYKDGHQCIHNSRDGLCGQHSVKSKTARNELNKKYRQQRNIDKIIVNSEVGVVIEQCEQPNQP